MIDKTLESALKDLESILKDLGSVVVAFSGGVDSTYLAYAAKQVLGDKAMAITVDSPYIPRWEIEEAKDLAKAIGIKHHIMSVGMDDSVKLNPENRCYVCKTLIFTEIIRLANEFGFHCVVDGSNADDTKDYRPGLVALKELAVESPLLKSGLTKAQIRQASKEAGLVTHDKPAYACLLTRLPYNQEVTDLVLKRIEDSETYLHGIGFKAVRVRAHGDLARIEIAKEDRERFMKVETFDKVSQTLKAFGFTFVAMELEGYKMGSLNNSIQRGE